MECGVRCVGKYACAGPLVAAAVIWGANTEQDISQYEKLSPTKLENLAEYVKTNAIDWSVAFLHTDVIDYRNIISASAEVMNTALEKLRVEFDTVVAKESFNTDHDIRIDDSHLALCAASILAKSTRNTHMRELATQEPYKIYNWERNMGYGTPNHKNAIDVFGISDKHRYSFGFG